MAPVPVPGRAGPGSGSGPGSDDDWPPHLRLTLLAEFALYAGVVAGWKAAGSRPSGVAQYALLIIAACAMGIQSAVSQMGLGNVSTTYLTGTLTSLIGAVARRDGKPVGWRSQSVLLGLLAGATASGLCVANVAALAPVLPLLAVGTALTIF